MDTELLRTFLEVNKTRHFGKASENLYLTQAAVSARIKQLEDSLGVPLFIRARNNIQLTTEGERLLPHAETMMLSWSRAKQEVGLKKEQALQLNIATTAGLWRFILHDKLTHIHATYPELALRADAHSSDELLRLLQEGIVDIGVHYEPMSLPGLSVKPIGKLKLILVSSQTYSSYKEATLHNYLYIDWGTSFGIFHAKKFPDTTGPVLHTNMASIAESYLNEHGGSAYLPEALLEQLKRKGLQPVTGSPSFSKDVFAVYKTNFKDPDLLPGLLDILTL